MDEQQAVTAVAKAVSGIDEAHFAAWPGGWPEQIGMALIDAVYSIRANYHAKNPAKGVLNRAHSFREMNPEAANDLELIRSLGEKGIRDLLGNGKTSGR